MKQLTSEQWKQFLYEVKRDKDKLATTRQIKKLFRGKK